MSEQNRSPHRQKTEAYRPVVMGRQGMVCAGHPLAAQAGITVLQQGGDAVDAAIAVAAALGVVELAASGIGGDGFIMLYRAATGEAHVVNGTGPAPQGATWEAYTDTGIPTEGGRSVSVPGIADAWLQAHSRYGRLSRDVVLAPAIDLAGNGFPVGHQLAAGIAAHRPLREFPSSRAVFFPHGHPPGPGELLYQRDLARTLERVAADGRAAFYAGPIAAAIARACRETGGSLSKDDLAAFHAEWQEPIETTYRGHRVLEAPPNSSGHVLLQELNLIEPFDLAAMGWLSAEAVHLMVEAKRLAFADRETYMADPAWVDVPLAGLISKEYAAERGRLLDPRRSLDVVSAGDPWAFEPGGRRPAHRPVAVGRREQHEDTTCFCVVDREGNAVCQLQSVQMAFGSGLIAAGTGILLNNRMTYWHLDPDHPDCLAPGKRVRHTMNPVMVLAPSDDGRERLRLVLGTPGADTQVQTNLQLITHVLDYGLTVTEAVEAPRWRHLQDGTESSVPHTCPDELRLEGRFPAATRDGLSARGHPVQVIGDWAGTGSAMMIRVHPASGAYEGAADPRRDGYAIGY